MEPAHTNATTKLLDRWGTQTARPEPGCVKTAAICSQRGSGLTMPRLAAAATIDDTMQKRLGGCS